jgi:predicted nucleic acid-binding protein
MKVFFDTNVYIAEALLGRAAERMVVATIAARWRIYVSEHVLDELDAVSHRLGFSRRLAASRAGFRPRPQAKRRSRCAEIRSTNDE